MASPPRSPPRKRDYDRPYDRGGDDYYDRRGGLATRGDRYRYEGRGGGGGGGGMDYRERDREHRERDHREREHRERDRERDRYYPNERRRSRDRYGSPPPKRLRGDWEEDRRREYRGEYPPTDRDGFDREKPATNGRARPEPADESFDRGSSRASREFLFEWPLKSYKHFLDTLEGNVPPEEATQKYEQYTAEFNRRHLRKFFDEYKSHEWMKERHHPEKLERLQAHLTKHAQEQAKLFAQELEEGKLHPCFDHPDADASTTPTSSSTTSSSTATDGEASESTDATSTTDAAPATTSAAATTPAAPATTTSNSNNNSTSGASEDLDATLFIKVVPVTMSKDALRDALESVPNCKVVRLTLSKPNPKKSWTRIGWVTYETAEQAYKALKALEGVKLGDTELPLATNRSGPVYPRMNIAPSITASDSRIASDLETSERLMRLFDTERKIEENAILKSGLLDSPDKQPNEKLDLILAYLRRVHCYCFYCAAEYDEESIMKQCGLTHVRGRKRDSSEADTSSRVTQMDARHKKRLESAPTRALSESQERAVQDMYNANIMQLGDSKFQCFLCGKLFKGFEFVAKHILNRHPEKVTQAKEEELERLYAENFMADSDSLTWVAAAAQSSMAVMVQGMRRPDMMPMGVPGMFYAPPPPPRGYMPPHMQHQAAMYRGGGAGGMHPPPPPPFYGRMPYGMMPPFGPGMGHMQPSMMMPPPPPGIVPDPRALREYVDLDAPGEGAVAIDYRTQVTYD